MAKAKRRRAAPLGLTKERRAKAIESFREYAVYARAADAVGVSRSRFDEWRTEHPDFQAELDEAARQYDLNVGQLARCALTKHLNEYLNETPTWAEGIVQKTGQKAKLRSERDLNIAAIRTGLTKLDPDWTHPRQQVEHSGTLTVTEQVAEAAARLEK